MQLRLTIWLILVGSTILNGQGLSKEQVSNFVFQISSDDCGRRLSGFMLDGHSGIYTSLHGVLGCKDIVAQNSFKTYYGLKIVMVDIDHDIALLASPEIEALSNGLPLETSKVKGGLEIQIWPYSYGVDVIMDNIAHIRKINPMVKLRTIAEADNEAFKKLKERNSPSINMEVINIQGGVKPGSSGAPITHDGKVIGMATGEIKKSLATDFCFGISMRNVGLVHNNEKVANELLRIASLPVSNLYLNEDIDENSLQGELKPDSRINSKRSVTVSIGRNIIVTSHPLNDGELYMPFTSSIIPVRLPLKIKIKADKVLVSCIFRNLDGKAVAEIIDNEWVINPNNYFQRNYDKNGLEVTDEDGTTRFQIDFKDMNNFIISGIFVDGKNIVFALPPNAGNRMPARIIALNSITKEEIRAMYEQIPYMFVYPSIKHFGERVR